MYGVYRHVLVDDIASHDRAYPRMQSACPPSTGARIRSVTLNPSYPVRPPHVFIDTITVNAAMQDRHTWTHFLCWLG